MVEGEKPRVSNVEDGIVTGRITCGDIIAAVGVDADSPHYVDVFEWVAKRQSQFFSIKSEEDLHIQVSQSRGQELLDGVIGFISALEQAKRAPKREPERNYGNWVNDPTKSRKPTMNQAIRWVVEEDSESDEEKPTPKAFAARPVFNGMQEPEANNREYRVSDLLREAGWENRRIRGKLKIKKFLEKRGIDTSEHNFIIPPAEVFLLRMELEEAKREN